ncbi:MAG TPA: phage holin family protein [Caulobacteraceae bacterium]|nr:phage holin family protein [Caulobacteraceae bacterium]
MIRFVVHAIAAAIGFWVAARIVPGVSVGTWQSLVAAGLVLGLINALVRPILVFLTFPLTLVTLGLFLLVVNGFTVWLVTVFIHGVHLSGPIAAILTALVISIVSWIAGGLVGRSRRVGI